MRVGKKKKSPTFEWLQSPGSAIETTHKYSKDWTGSHFRLCMFLQWPSATHLWLETLPSKWCFQSIFMWEPRNKPESTAKGWSWAGVADGEVRNRKVKWWAQGLSASFLWSPSYEVKVFQNPTLAPNAHLGIITNAFYRFSFLPNKQADTIFKYRVL